MSFATPVFQARLKQLIVESKFVKQVAETAPAEDFAKSF